MSTYTTNYLHYQVCQESDSYSKCQYLKVTDEQIEQIVDMLVTKFGYVRILRGDTE